MMKNIKRIFILGMLIITVAVIVIACGSSMKEKEAEQNKEREELEGNYTDREEIAQDSQNSIQLKYVKEQQANMQNEEMVALLKQAQNAVDQMDLSLDQDTVYMIFLSAYYDDSTKKMTSWFAFVNNTGKTMEELHGEIRMKYNGDDNVKIATTTIDLDSEFMGEVQHGEGILVSLNIPIKGMNESKEIKFSDIEGIFDDVRVTYKED